jgi:thiosulfate/3-mercaptopyruvate sulfurtransferase
MHPLISATELLQSHQNKSLVILDASKAFDEKSVVPGAVRFDLSGAFSDQKSPFPNTMPSPKVFETECRKLGLNTDSDIVVYDNDKLFNSPRVWYMFKAMGHDKVRVLDGAMPAWKNAGGETTVYSEIQIDSGNFKANFSEKAFRDLGWVKNNIELQSAVLIDARSEGRFKGIEPEPRPGLRSGSIPNSCNLPFTKVLENGCFKSKEKLQEIFNSLEDTEKTFVFSCGSGVTACILLLAATLAEYQHLSVYDGSWTEWATLVE